MVEHNHSNAEFGVYFPEKSAEERLTRVIENYFQYSRIDIVNFISNFTQCIDIENIELAAYKLGQLILSAIGVHNHAHIYRLLCTLEQLLDIIANFDSPEIIDAYKSACLSIKRVVFFVKSRPINRLLKNSIITKVEEDISLYRKHEVVSQEAITRQESLPTIIPVPLPAEKKAASKGFHYKLTPWFLLVLASPFIIFTSLILFLVARKGNLVSSIEKSRSNFLKNEVVNAPLQLEKNIVNL